MDEAKESPQDKIKRVEQRLQRIRELTREAKEQRQDEVERPRHYILVDGEPTPTDVLTCHHWFEENRAKWVLRKTKIGEAMVSTVFLFMDHNFLDDGPPVLFELMVFGGRLHGAQDRFTTQDEALMCHDFVVQTLLKGL